MKPSTMETNSMNEVDAYREYTDQVRPTEPLRAQFDSFHLVASTCRIWHVHTKHPLAALLAPNYYDNVSDLRLRADDQLHVVTGIGNGPATHALLCVDSVDKRGGDVKVSLLAKYERAS